MHTHKHTHTLKALLLYTSQSGLLRANSPHSAERDPIGYVCVCVRLICKVEGGTIKPNRFTANPHKQGFMRMNVKFDFAHSIHNRTLYSDSKGEGCQNRGGEREYRETFLYPSVDRSVPTHRDSHAIRTVVRLAPQSNMTKIPRKHLRLP